MSDAVFEFPLKEKVRNYLRVEQLLGQLKITAKAEQSSLQLVFFEQLFELLDLIERIDLRSDLTKDLEAHEKNLVYWSKHPKIDTTALEHALKTVLRLRQKIKTDGRFGYALKEDKLLSSIRQRFAIPGGACRQSTFRRKTYRQITCPQIISRQITCRKLGHNSFNLSKEPFVKCPSKIDLR